MHSVYNRRNVNVSNVPRTSKGFLQYMTQQTDMTSDLNIWMDTGAGKREHECNDIGESDLGANTIYIDLASKYVE